MKKRHQQKLIFLSLGVLLLLNIPLVFAFNQATSLLGFPVFYFSMFCIWMASILISFLILKNYSD